MNAQLLEQFEREPFCGRVPLKRVGEVLGCSRRTVTNLTAFPAVHPKHLAVVRDARHYVTTTHLRKRAEKLTG